MKTLHKNTSAVFYAGKVRTLEMIAQIRDRLHRLEVTKMKKLSLILILALILSIGYQLSAIGYTYAQIPQLISYQGRLTDASGTPITGNRNMTFRIYDAKTGGSKVWEDTYSVTIDEGIFDVLLGGGSQVLALSS